MKLDVQALLQKARASLQAAELLSREGFDDFAAARAYYAMFYAAQALLLDRNLSFSSHSAVIAAFGKEFSRTGLLGPRFHRYLIDSQDIRNIGDYGVDVGVTLDQVEETIQWAHEFVSAAEGLLQA